MHSDDNRKRKAAQTANTSSKKHKIDSPTTSRVALGTPTRPTTRSTSKNQSASTATVHSARRRVPSPGPADTYRTRSKTGSLKSKRRPYSPSGDRAPPPAIGLSQSVAETQRKKKPLPDPTSTGSPSAKKRPKRPPKPLPKPEDIIVLSSDGDEEHRPRKRARRHTTQISEIIDLTKDETPTPPKPRTTRARPPPLPTPTPVASPSTPAFPSSPSKYIDLRHVLLSKSKPTTSSSYSHSHSYSQSQTQTPISPSPLKTEFTAPSPAEKCLNDAFTDDDERESPPSNRTAAAVLMANRKPAPAVTPKAKPKFRRSKKIEPEPEPKPKRNSSSSHAVAGTVESVLEGSKGVTFERGRMLLSKARRAWLQEEEEEEEEEKEDTMSPAPALSIDSTTATATATTGAIPKDVNVDNSPAQLRIKTEDVEDTYINYSPPVSTLEEEEESVAVVKKETQLVAPSPNADLGADEEEQNDLEEAIFQSMLVASAVEAAVPLDNQEGSQVEREEWDGSSLVVDASSVRDPARSEAPVALEGSEREGEVEQEEEQEVGMNSEETQAEKLSNEEMEVPTNHPPCPPTPTPAPACAVDFGSYLDFDLEQERADLEEALFQSQLSILYSPPISEREDEVEDEFGMDDFEQGQGQDQDQVDVDVLPTPTLAGNLNPYEEDLFVIEDLDSAITLPATASMDDEDTYQVPSNANDVTEAKDGDDEEDLARTLSPELSVPLSQVPQVAASRPFPSSVPTTTRFAELAPTESAGTMFVAGQLTQRFFAQSCLPPRAKTRAAAKPVEVEKLVKVVEMQVVEPVVEAVKSAVEEVQKEDLVMEVGVQSMVEEVQVEKPAIEELVQSEHEAQSPVAEMEVEEKPVEELPVQSGIEGMQMSVVLDVGVSDAEILESEDVEVEMGIVYADVEIEDGDEGEEGDGHGEKDVVSILPTDVNGNDDAAAVPEQNEVPGVEATYVKVKATTIEALEKDPTLSRALHGSRMLLEIIKDVLKRSEPEPEVAPAIQVEEAGDEMHSPLPQTSTPEPEALVPTEDHNTPSPDEESSSPQQSTSEPLVQTEDTDDDPSWQSVDVTPTSLQVVEKVTPQPLAKVECSGHVPHHHERPSSPQTSTPESSAHQIEDVIAAPSGPLEVSPSPRPRMPTPEPPAHNEDINVAPIPNYLEVLPAPRPQTLTSSALALDSQRRTMSNTGSESSLATSDDSPPPSTPPQSIFESYYIRSTSPDDDLDIYSKLTDIPSFPLPGSDEDDDEYLLSLDFSYPDFDIVG
ncbi:hypothetical protein C0995_000170 [Termitomyces sp. Mi166|nr:hypothetical protein C0995_000170 [Termitomyces sp. Mi166\